MAVKKAAWATTAEEESINDHRLQWVKNQMLAGALPGDLTDGRQAEVAARNRLSRCLTWIDAASGCGYLERARNLDDLISIATSMRELLRASKERLALEPSWTDTQGRVVDDYSRKYDEWLGRWQRARAEADAVGLDGREAAPQADVLRLRENRSAFFACARLLRRLPRARGYVCTRRLLRARRFAAILQRGVPARALARGAHD